MKEKLMEALHWRSACKSYDPHRKIPQEDMDFILEAARLSPSSFGFEPWNFLVFTDFSIFENMRERAWGLVNSLNGASHIVVILARKKTDMEPESEYLATLMKDQLHMTPEQIQKRSDRYQKFLEVDLSATTERSVFDWSSKQTYIALSYMLIAAAMIRIDACPVEGFHYNAIEEMLINEGCYDPEHFGVSVIVSFGYRSKEPDQKKARQTPEKIIRYL